MTSQPTEKSLGGKEHRDCVAASIAHTWRSTTKQTMRLTCVASTYRHSKKTTSEQIHAKVDQLATQKEALNKTRFSELEKRLGFAHAPAGLLMDVPLRAEEEGSGERLIPEVMSGNER